MTVAMSERRGALDTHQQGHDHAKRKPSPVWRGRDAAMMVEQTHGSPELLCTQNGIVI